MEHAVIVQVCVPERKSTIGLSSFEKGEHSRSELKQSLRETFTQICKPRDKVIGLQWGGASSANSNLFQFHFSIATDQRNLFQFRARPFGIAGMDAYLYHVHLVPLINGDNSLYTTYV